jgi:predicted metal-dependent hydrolase
MSETIYVANLEVSVTKKNIKNVHLSVHPPNGVVKLSVPTDADPDTLKAFVLTKLDWIRRHQKKFASQSREPVRELIERESLYIWGTRYLLKIQNYDGGGRVDLDGKHLVLHTRAGSSVDQRREILEAWLRSQVRNRAKRCLKIWSKKLGVAIPKLYIQRMKTKWGSCSPTSQSIRLNTELAHKNHKALEYVIVHELMHLIEPKHNAQFFQLMDAAYPEWRGIRRKLNSEILSHSISRNA